MKAFASLSEQELIALSEDDIQRYIDYACAENGVPLLPAQLPEPPKADHPEADRTIYNVGTAYCTDISCVDLTEAQRLASVLNEIQTVSLAYVPGPTTTTDRMMEPKRGPYIVTPTPCFSAELAASIRPRLEDAQRAQKLYEASKREYDAAVKERAAYADEIREKVSAAWQTHNRREARRRDYERYLTLADGNAEIAARFLANAHGDALMLLPDLFIVPAMPAVEARPEEAR